MKANELRIGNLIRWKDESEEIVNITGIEHDEQGYWICTGEKEQAQIEEFIPIELTEQWFIDLGCFNMEYGFEYQLEPETVLRIIESCGECYPQLDQIGESTYEPQQIVMLNSIKYVHQLQNLYFALTGEELEIK